MAQVKAKQPPRRTGLARKSATAGPSKKKPAGKLPLKLTRQVKTKPGSQPGTAKKKKMPQYTDKQLGLPTLNTIVPANAKTQQKAGGTGKKKNKVYVDDTESMMTILAMVNAEKEGQIESKVAKERQMEEIREARRKEAEKKEKKKEKKVEAVKEEIKGEKKKRRSTIEDSSKSANATPEKTGAERKKRKSVSFA